MLRPLAWLAGLALCALIAYLLLWPVPVHPVAWGTASSPGYTGAHAVNHGLANLNLIDLGPEEGPEHVAFGPDGKLYTAVASGKLLRMNSDGSAQQVFASTGGRVLGFAFDAVGNLIAADAYKGLLQISPQGTVRVLADNVRGDPIRYANSVILNRNGLIYFTDASTRFNPHEVGGTFAASILDLLEQSATGRVLEHDPSTGTTRIVARGLSFANGITLSQQEQWLFVAETGRYRVWRIAASASGLDLSLGPSDQATVLLDNLPGYPDNLMRGQAGRIWMGFAKPRSALVDAMADKPWLRAMTLRLPRAWWPVPESYGHVVAFAEDGRILADLQDPSGAYPETTSVTETVDRLYVQSLHAKGLGWKAK
jgi:sugar lactone lactonase YvrE